MSLLHRISSSLGARASSGKKRSLPPPSNVSTLLDFCSNDYLGMSLHPPTLPPCPLPAASGSTGSRLLSGNSSVHLNCESYLQSVHRPSRSFPSPPSLKRALLFNSGYDANLSLLSSLPLSNDVVLLDELAHNSLQEGVRLSRTPRSNVHSFPHNDAHALHAKLLSLLRRVDGGRAVSPSSSVSVSSRSAFVVVESVYSMDGTIAPLSDLLAACASASLETGVFVHLIVDEAHGTGIYGETNLSDVLPDVMSCPRPFVPHPLDGFTQPLPPSAAVPAAVGGGGVVAALNLQRHPNLLCSVHPFGKGVGRHGCVLVAHDSLFSGGGSGVPTTSLSTPTTITLPPPPPPPSSFSSSSSSSSSVAHQSNSQSTHPLLEYLYNYARPLIYSTSLPPSSVWDVHASYMYFSSPLGCVRRRRLFDNVSLFLELAKSARLPMRGGARGPIQAVMTGSGGSQKCVDVARTIREQGFDVMPIRAPTVKEGEERIRVVLHSHNEEEDIRRLVGVMRKAVA